MSPTVPSGNPQPPSPVASSSSLPGVRVTLLDESTLARKQLRTTVLLCPSFARGIQAASDQPRFLGTTQDAKSTNGCCRRGVGRTQRSAVPAIQSCFSPHRSRVAGPAFHDIRVEQLSPTVPSGNSQPPSPVASSSPLPGVRVTLLDESTLARKQLRTTVLLCPELRSWDTGSQRSGRNLSRHPAWMPGAQDHTASQSG
ncbi:hypothetical protein RISK_003906 [Rhodopirellula islandica]|uniref:Uncharacterized protein n=1 Tax=Rhodopirellula islandica TaxID=595434 RepID=A0A0J1BBC8_RHOIS|nr:hypothetical protein RISK_003906 [Rhodopirellula islandica]